MILSLQVKLLRTLSHPSLIACYGAWATKDEAANKPEKVVFVTELMSSGTLKE